MYATAIDFAVFRDTLSTPAMRQIFSDEARVVVSEPLIDLPGLWHEIEPGTALVVQDGPDLDLPFTPRLP